VVTGQADQPNARQQFFEMRGPLPLRQKRLPTTTTRET
jgi:hypothetical protein